MNRDDFPDPLGLADKAGFPDGLRPKRTGPFNVPLPALVVAEEDSVVDQPQQSATNRDEQADPVIEAAEMGEDYIDRVEEAIETEDCAFCEQVLRSLRNRPVQEQVQGIQELAELKRQTKGDIDVEELEAAMEDFEVITAGDVM